MEDFDDLAELAQLIEARILQHIREGRILLAKRQQQLVFLLEVEPDGIDPVRGFLGDVSDLLGDVGLDRLADLVLDNRLGFVRLHLLGDNRKYPLACVVYILRDERQPDKPGDGRDDAARHHPGNPAANALDQRGDDAAGDDQHDARDRARVVEHEVRGADFHGGLLCPRLKVLLALLDEDLRHRAAIAGLQRRLHAGDDGVGNLGGRRLDLRAGILGNARGQFIERGLEPLRVISLIRDSRREAARRRLADGGIGPVNPARIRPAPPRWLRPPPGRSGRLHRPWPSICSPGPDSRWRSARS